jgi:hypothetical protein
MIIISAMVQQNLLFTGAAKSTLLADIGEGDIDSPINQRACRIGIEGDIREVMDFKDGADIEVEAVANNLHINAIPATILIERFEMGIDIRMVLDEVENVFWIPSENLYDTGVSFSRSNFALAIIPIDGLPISRTKPVEQDITHVFDADRSIEVT